MFPLSNFASTETLCSLSITHTVLIVFGSLGLYRGLFSPVARLLNKICLYSLDFCPGLVFFDGRGDCRMLLSKNGLPLHCCLCMLVWFCHGITYYVEQQSDCKLMALPIHNIKISKSKIYYLIMYGTNSG